MASRIGQLVPPGRTTARGWTTAVVFGNHEDTRRARSPEEGVFYFSINAVEELEKLSLHPSPCSLRGSVVPALRGPKPWQNFGRAALGTLFPENDYKRVKFAHATSFAPSHHFAKA